MGSNLNQIQQEAVEYINGPILILAGAGTGKTTVVTHRIANLISQGYARLDEILAVTFTNKAAGEMKHRISDLIQESGYKSESWIGTFHSICLRILKLYYERIGLETGFSIADSTDQRAAVKKALNRLEISEKIVPIKLALHVISGLKNEGISFADESEVAKHGSGDFDIVSIYREYQAILKEANCVDFDDLIMLCISLFRDNVDILYTFQKKWKYIFVDEYQDTNKMQHALITLLSAGHQNICCVGDDDQSIYSWRGADISNILGFQKQFPNAKIITLRDNYRSTQAILDFAQSIIGQNKKRYNKNLISHSSSNKDVKIISVNDDRSESEKIVYTVRGMLIDKEINTLNNCAVLVRTTAQMRSIEEAFIKHAMPYKIIGGVKFYERKEIKDAIAYIKLLISDTDFLAFERIANIPARGVGEKTLDSIIEYARYEKLPIIPGIHSMINQGKLGKKAALPIYEMLQKLEEARKMLHQQNTTVSFICAKLLEDVGYMEMMRNEAKEDKSFEKRIDNVSDLLNSIGNFHTLQDFFDHIALIADTDAIDDLNSVNIMTIHASKGLEFQSVILPGWEEDIFPNKRVIDESGHAGLEEERRLAYVAVTRAKQHLIILHAKIRFMYGRLMPCIKSRFLSSTS